MGIGTLNRWRKRRKAEAEKVPVEAEKTSVPAKPEPSREEKPQQKPYRR